MSASALAENIQGGLISTFFIGDTLYGIDAMSIQEVVRVGEITKVHHAQPHIVGIMNLRGKIVTLIDLAMKLELGQIETTNKSRIIIMEYKGEYVGLLVDAVSDVVTMDPERLATPPSNVKGAQSTFLESVYQDAKHLIAILNAGAVLLEEES